MSVDFPRPDSPGDQYKLGHYMKEVCGAASDENTDRKDEWNEGGRAKGPRTELNIPTTMATNLKPRLHISPALITPET
jgi:hypothetical protein